MISNDKVGQAGILKYFISSCSAPGAHDRSLAFVQHLTLSTSAQSDLKHYILHSIRQSNYAYRRIGRLNSARMICRS